LILFKKWSAWHGVRNSCLTGQKKQKPEGIWLLNKSIVKTRDFREFPGRALLGQFGLSWGPTSGLFPQCLSSGQLEPVARPTMPVVPKKTIAPARN
jgi:hypothetical protein